jgi:hypothetical protein
MTRAMPVLVALAVLGAPVTANAQSDAAAAEVLYNDAIEAKAKKDFTTACLKFAESYRLDPTAPTLVMVAECEAKAGKIADAWSHLQEALAKLRDPRQIAYARKLSGGVEKRVPRLTVTLAAHVSDATVKRDGVELRSASLGAALPVNPGEHTIIVTAPGRQDATYTVSLAEGRAAEVEVAPGPLVAAPPAAETPSPTAARHDDAKDSRGTTVGYLLLGGGAVGLIVGATFALQAKSRFDDAAAICKDRDRACPQDQVQARDDHNAEGRSAQSMSTVGFVLGGALAAGGVAWLVWAPGSGKSASLAPLVGPRDAQLAFGGFW